MFELLTEYAGLVQGVALCVIVACVFVVCRRRARRELVLPAVDADAEAIRQARRQLRGIEWQLSQLDPRADVAEVRRLTALHQRWRHYLAEHGVNHPAPVIAW